MNLNKKVLEILKSHKGGKEFFDALDKYISTDFDILKHFVDFLKQNTPTQQCNLVLSGKFGLALINNFGKELYTHFDSVILFNGGIRSGDEPQAFISKTNDKPFVFADDSIYSCTTRNKISDYLKSIPNTITEMFTATPLNIFIKTLVVYDGCKEKHIDVKSLFRYHD